MILFILCIAFINIGWMCAATTLFDYVKVPDWVEVLFKYGIPLYVVSCTDFVDKIGKGLGL